MIKIDKEKATEIISSYQIPARPEILHALHQEQTAREPDIHKFGQIISLDISLAACVLKTINSPVFGLNRTVTDIQQSVMLLGMDNIINLVSFFELRNKLSGKACISLERFWDSSTEVANVMVFLQQRLNLKIPPEYVYSGGLFRDCGIPLLAMKYQNYKETLVTANNTPDRQVTDIEEECHDTNHTVVGYFVGTSWNLPDIICELILRHHDPTVLQDVSCSEEFKILFCLFKMADNIINEHRRFRPSNDWRWAEEQVMYYLGISEPDYNEIRDDVIDDIEHISQTG